MYPFHDKVPQTGLELETSGSETSVMVGTKGRSVDRGTSTGYIRVPRQPRSTLGSESIESAYRKPEIYDAGVCLAALSRCVISLSRCVTIPLRLQPVCQRGHTSTGTGRPVFVRQGTVAHHIVQVAREGRQRSSKLYPKVQIGTEVIMGGIGCRLSAGAHCGMEGQLARGVVAL